MNKAEKQELIGLILMTIVELKEAGEEGESDEVQESLWRDIEDRLTALAYGEK